MAADNEGKVSEDSDRGGVLPHAPPLLIRDPLQPRTIANLAREPLPRGGQRVRLPVTHALIPFEPVSAAIFLAERPEQRVVGQPP